MTLHIYERNAEFCSQTLTFPETIFLSFMFTKIRFYRRDKIIKTKGGTTKIVAKRWEHHTPTSRVQAMSGCGIVKPQRMNDGMLVSRFKTEERNLRQE